VVSKTYITFGDNGQGHVLSEGEIKVSDKVILRPSCSTLGFNFLSVSQLLDESLRCCFVLVVLGFWILEGT
jgi:hypothetical protein